MHNAALWDAIGEYAETYREYMDARDSKITDRRLAFEVARDNLTALIGKRNDQPLTEQEIGGGYA